MPITRLICVQGPSQLLDVMSILLFQQKEQPQDYNDVLVIGGLCMSGNIKSSEDVVEITKLISSHWQFNAVYDISNFESRLNYIFKITKRLGNRPSLMLLNLIAKLVKNITSLDNVDQIYVCRNWHHFNEILLFTYAKAEKVCYGDIGHLDIDDEQQKKGLINPKGFITIDRSYLIFPPEYTKRKFRNYKICIVSADYKRKLINDISKSNAFTDLANFCLEKLNFNILITLSNGTEAGIHNSVFEEVQLYLSIVLSESDLGDIVWIKPHPRQTLNQSQILCNLINKSGRKAYCINKFDRYPLELFIPHLSSTKVICLYSYSGVMSALLGYKNLVIGLDEKLVHSFVKREHRRSFVEYQKIYVAMLEKALSSTINFSSSKISPCSPLTNSQNVILLKEYPCLSLIKEWKDSFDIDISNEITFQSSIKMYQCIDTDLKFFTPIDFMGSENLYSQLSRFPWYYLKDKWEYQAALKACKQFHKIIDIGCGKGEFIKLGKRYGIDILGIDMISDSIDIPKNVNIENISVEMAAKKYKKHFEAVCCFQVLEHVADPRNLIKNLLDMLKPSGRLILSVPNAESFLKYTDSPLDMPPHHMTKWSEATFRKLECYFPIKIEKVLKEPLMTYQIAGYVSTYCDVYKQRYPFLSFCLGKPFKVIFYILLYAGLRYLVTGQSLYVQYKKN
jgi:SAM-dependent methyltransferase